MTRVIIAGSREGFTLDDVYEAVFDTGWEITRVVSGGARGVDTYGEQFAEHFDIPIHRMLADWDKFGKSAGYRRNVQMAENADKLLALWDGKSKGTKHMIDTALKKGLEVHIYTKGK